MIRQLHVINTEGYRFEAKTHRSSRRTQCQQFGVCYFKFKPTNDRCKNPEGYVNCQELSFASRDDDDDFPRGA